MRHYTGFRRACASLLASLLLAAGAGVRAGEVEVLHYWTSGGEAKSLAELKGHKPGHVLQGPETDRVAVGRIRTALRERQSCRETVVNYHKDGSNYRAEVNIMPILDDAGEPLWFVARERKLAEA